MASDFVIICPKCSTKLQSPLEPVKPYDYIGIECKSCERPIEKKDISNQISKYSQEISKEITSTIKFHRNDFNITIKHLVILAVLFIGFTAYQIHDQTKFSSHYAGLVESSSVFLASVSAGEHSTTRRRKTGTSHTYEISYNFIDNSRISRVGTEYVSESIYTGLEALPSKKRYIEILQSNQNPSIFGVKENWIRNSQDKEELKIMEGALGGIVLSLITFFPLMLVFNFISSKLRKRDSL